MKGPKRKEFAEWVCASREAIGKYERGEVRPSIEMASRRSQALGTSLDHLAGDSSVPARDKQMARHLELLQNTSEQEQEDILRILDLLLKEAEAHEKNIEQKLASRSWRSKERAYRPTRSRRSYNSASSQNPNKESRP